ncbi:glycosyltransferase [Methylobacterium sp. Leaf466]|uniref:glycosyltransferase n=1 Tax=Methylobacterium sp. Leaf466 TaxID=1736386 RepID=UPI0009E7E46E|nr:glycosyltransferase [Methylobacterium sp. Leaf466]
MQPMNIIFVLPSSGGGGGANSIVQEAIGLSRLGCNLEIAVDLSHYNGFKLSYPELERFRVVVRPYANADQLSAHFWKMEIVVATTNASIFTVREALKLMTSLENGRVPRVAYYVQDYEPLFYAPHSAAWSTAKASYTLIPNAVLFAKTKWLQDIVYANHGVRVAKVEPSIDHDIYFPDLSRQKSMTSIVAMLRPSTPRRAPQRTVRIMNILAQTFGQDIALSVFGCEQQDIQAGGLSLSASVNNRGRLRRTEVPSLLRQAHLFLDLSDFQAFGRTGAESMACGCVPILPVFGGASEFAVHGRNAYLVDTRSDQAVLEAAEHFISLDGQDRESMSYAALETGARFSIASASLSELKLFSAMLR